MSLIKIAILLILLIIIGSLGSALFHLIKGDSASATSLAKALTVRISLSLALLGFIILAYAMGWLSPHDILPVATSESP